MGCRFWIFFRKLTALQRHCTVSCLENMYADLVNVVCGLQNGGRETQNGRECPSWNVWCRNDLFLGHRWIHETFIVQHASTGGGSLKRSLPDVWWHNWSTWRLQGWYLAKLPHPFVCIVIIVLNNVPSLRMKHYGLNNGWASLCESKCIT